MTEHEEYLAVLKASYDYDPQSEEELAITENQIVFLLERTDDDWWKVKIKGESQEQDSPSGLVPAAYVEQAEHTSLVRAIYDYDAAAPGELSIKEDEILMVFDREEEWLLVQSKKEGGKAGFVPGNYVEEATGVESTPALASAALRIVVPPSPEPPARPVSVYVDPADRVAQSKTQARVSDDIKTWSVSEVDKKGKKKKGTLGIGNGALFFASESDKTPVQKWQISDVEDTSVEKNKHVHIGIGGPSATKLHFNVGSRDAADAVVEKLEASCALATAEHRAVVPPPQHTEVSSPQKKHAASVRFAQESPAIIPPREPSEDGEEQEEDVQEETQEGGQAADDGEPAIALYDFEGTGSDELTVQEGERLWIIEKEGEEWWKCRNEHGIEGVVPASYLEVSHQTVTRADALYQSQSTGGVSVATEPEDDDDAEREEQERLEAERKEEERMEHERVEKDRKKKEQEQRAKAAAAAAETDRKRREKEEAAAAAEAERRKRQEAAKSAQQKAERAQSSSPRPPTSQIKSRDSTSSAGRNSSESHKNSTRMWHDRSGQFRVEAAFLGYASGKLRLHKVNGVVIEVPSEKMSREDMRYVERLTTKKASPPVAQPRPSDDDDQPLALKQKEVVRRATMSAQPKKSQTDWFEFFLNAGCDIDDCTRYATSFERDKIDEAILPDTTESTMRSLGLREGDIIRVTKYIQQKYSKPKKDMAQEQLIRDEELARQLQEEENGGRSKGTSSPAPNLFAGPGGILKNNTQRRGRPQPSKSLPPPAVDLNAISSASDQIKRTGSPLVGSPVTLTPVQPPQRSSSTVPVTSGFDDDAWTNRPGSKPMTTRAPSAPPVAATAPTAVATVSAASAAPTQSPAAPPAQATSEGLAKTDADIFDQLARLSQLKTTRLSPSPAPASAAMALSPPIVSSPPASYNAGLGMGSSPTAIGQPLQNHQTGAVSLQGPRGPFAPVPANHSLLQPLIPTTTGFNSFVPTRPISASPYQGQPPLPFLSAQPTGFHGTTRPLMSQSTGLPPSGPLLSQPTGIPGGSFGTFSAPPSFQNTAMQAAQPNPTGVFAHSPFNNAVSSPSPPSLYSQLNATSNTSPANVFAHSPFNNVVSSTSPPSLYSQPNATPNTSPANIFAQMKSGTFASGNEHSGAQPAEAYNALRVNPIGPQPTGYVPQGAGWGFQPNNGFQTSGYTGY
ncbi:hypothetical protein K503DRAFT_512190 [Rhizopogon vinicolor AM-OR11-026]|uniref:Actin cytoskeleton-regulatory complex protein SLA1 n=1 Tax=Rhizopogon vinicolor AM-OR11-026 TaxID=1314800 RepID=A0A1B7N910_9AGAM|nr:hypothetical protein K503DRAFT_512190 [Rhizopogon vinicolor AM-OR11-026]